MIHINAKIHYFNGKYGIAIDRPVYDKCNYLFLIEYQGISKTKKIICWSDDCMRDIIKELRDGEAGISSVS